MKISSIFLSGDQIPNEYTCDGENISPPLFIEAVPSDAKSLALVMDDIDAPAGTFTHLIAWNISLNTTQIQKGNIPGETGINDYGKKGFGAICPPSGLHHYYFRLYALDKKLDLPSQTTRKEFNRAIKSHVIKEAALIGVYSRS